MPYCTYASHKDARDLLGIEWITLSAIISTTGLCHHNNEYLPILEGMSWSWSYGSCSYNYLCNQCLSPLRLWVRILFRRGVLDTTLCVCQWLSTGRWFSAGTTVSDGMLNTMAELESPRIHRFGFFLNNFGVETHFRYSI